MNALQKLLVTGAILLKSLGLYWEVSMGLLCVNWMVQAVKAMQHKEVYHRLDLFLSI